MIEHELATVPAGEASHRRGETREHKAVRQDRLGIVQPKPPIGAGDRDQGHCGHGVRPARLSQPDTGHQKEFAGANDAGRDAGPEGETSRPEANPRPERIARPPIERDQPQRWRPRRRSGNAPSSHESVSTSATADPVSSRSSSSMTGLSLVACGRSSLFAIAAILRVRSKLLGAIIASCTGRSTSESQRRCQPAQDRCQRLSPPDRRRLRSRSCGG